MSNSGLDNMFDIDRYDDLARLYRLCIMIPTGLATLRRAMKESILRRGTELNQSDEDDKPAEDPTTENEPTKNKGKAKQNNTAPADAAAKWVEDVLSLKDKFDKIWKDCFSGNHDIETSLNEVRPIF